MWHFNRVLCFIKWNIFCMLSLKCLNYRSDKLFCQSISQSINQSVYISGPPISQTSDISLLSTRWISHKFYINMEFLPVLWFLYWIQKGLLSMVFCKGLIVTIWRLSYSTFQSVIFLKFRTDDKVLLAVFCTLFTFQKYISRTIAG